MQAQKMTRFVFAIIFSAEGKRYLADMLKAAEILSLVCFEAKFAEESHVPVPQGPAGCQRRCRAGPSRAYWHPCEGAGKGSAGSRRARDPTTPGLL